MSWSGDPTRARRTLILGVVGALMLVVVGALAFGEDDDEPEAPPRAEASPSPSVESETLGENQAIQEFRRLHDLAQELSRNRDPNFASNVFTTQGPMWQRARTRIEELRSDQVLDHSTIEITRIEVEGLSPGEASILATTITSPCFVTEQGKDITEDERVVQSTVLWTLRVERGRWKLHEAELQNQEEVNKPRRQCA